MDLTLNLMNEDDLEEVVHISSVSLKESWSNDSFKKELSNPLAKYIVAKLNGQIVGFAGVWVIVDEGHITNIAVHPDFRNKNIGSQLVKALISNCIKWGCVALTLEVRESNIAAQGLYTKFGFLQEGLRKNYYNDNKESAVIMWKHELTSL